MWFIDTGEIEDMAGKRLLWDDGKPDRCVATEGRKIKKGEGRGCCIRMWVNAFLLPVVKSRGHRQEEECNAYITWSILSVKSALDKV